MARLEAMPFCTWFIRKSRSDIRNRLSSIGIFVLILCIFYTPILLMMVSSICPRVMCSVVPSMVRIR